MPGDFLEKRACENRPLIQTIQCPNCSNDNLVRTDMEVEYPIVCSECGCVILPVTDASSGDKCIGNTIYIKCSKCFKETEVKCDDE